MKFKITERDPLMCFWEEDYTLGGTRNQRDNDHDEIQAERHCQEIDNKLSFEDLITKNYVIDNNLEIDFGGTITMRLIDIDRGLWLTSDGLSRNTKIFLLGLSFRNFANDKSIFDKYMFRKETKDIRFEFMDEVGVFVNSNYRQVNDVVKEILLRDNKIQDVIDDNLDEDLFNQNYFVLRQLETYRDWVKNHEFKSDEELLNAFENILNLYRVVYTKSINDVDSFNINSDEVGVPTNGISSIANKVLKHLQDKYCSKTNQNDYVNEEVNEKIKFIFSPIRQRVKPEKDNVIETVSWVIKSHYITESGYDSKESRDTKLNVVSNEICKLLDKEIEEYGDVDCDGNVFLDSDDKSILIHIQTVLSNWDWHNDLNRINYYFENGIIRKGGTQWIPLLLKYEREKRRHLNSFEIRTIQLFDILGKFVKWNSFNKLLGTAINEIDKDTKLMSLLTKYFVEDNDITDIDFKNQLLKAYLLTKGKDSDTDSNNKYFKYLDRLFSKLSQKGNKKNWVNIDPYEVGDIEMEHFLARLYNSTERSLVRLFGVNFFALDKSTNGYVSNDDLIDKIGVIKGMDNTLGQLFQPNGKLEKEVSELLYSPEYEVFRTDTFNNKDWIDIASVGVIGDNLDSKLPTNLIYKYRSVQIDKFMEKVFND